MPADVSTNTPPPDQVDPGSGGINVDLRLPPPPWMKKHARLLCLLALALAAAVWSSFLPENRHQGMVPRLVMVTNWFAGGEHFITFRTEPPDTLIYTAGFYHEAAKPKPFQIRILDAPSRTFIQTNLSMRFVALPQTGVLSTNDTLIYLPETYVVAYRPSQPVHALQLELVYRKQGLSLQINRLRNAVCERLMPSFIEEPIDAAWWIYAGPFTNTLVAPAMPAPSVPKLLLSAPASGPASQ